MALNPIIEAFLAARQQASQDFDADMNRKARYEEEQLQREQQLKIQKNQLDQEKIIREADHQLRLKELEQSLKLGQESRDANAFNSIANLSAAGKLNIPNKQVTSLNPNIPIPQIGAIQTQDVPDFESAATSIAPLVGGDSQKALNMLKVITGPEEYNQQQLRIKEAEAVIKAKSEIDALRAKEAITQPGKLEVVREQNKSREGIAQQNRDATLEAARIRSNATLNAAAMRLANKTKEQGSNIPPGALSEIINADRTMDDLGKLYGIKDRTAIVNAADKEGIKILSKVDKVSLSRAGVISTVVRDAQRLSELYKQGYIKNAGEINSLTASINGVLGNVAKGVGGEAGVLTQTDIERIKEMLPSWFGSVKSDAYSLLGGKSFDINQAKVAKLKEYVKGTYGHVFHGMKPEQINILVHKHNATGLGLGEYLEKPPE